MCRLIAYIGNPLLLDDVLYKPKNSLIQQSIHAQDVDQPLNGDGFGLGWYNPDIDLIPGVFRSIQPAWNDQNLQFLATKIRSNCFFAHVRAASKGSVSLANCHPFQYQQYLFMHNGDIGDFTKIKRLLRRQLTDETYNWIQGQTDSEHFFALYLDIINKQQLHFTADNAAQVLRQTIHTVDTLLTEHQSDQPDYINAVVSDGKSMVAVRYISDLKEKSPTLFYACGSHYEFHKGICHLHPQGEGPNGAVLIASEKLSNHTADWHEVPVNHMLLVYADLSFAIQPI
jgi:predicted glutamine amidotransferase